jgi:hypothetical protein
MTVTIFVPDLPEFLPVVRSAEKVEQCTIVAPQNGYWRIEAEHEIQFSRKSLGLGHAIWNSALSGGFRGRIVEYGRDVMRICCED